MFGIGMTELMMILAVALLVLGPKRLPELARSLGKGLAELRNASREARREFLGSSSPEARVQTAPPAAAPELSPGLPADPGGPSDG